MRKMEKVWNQIGDEEDTGEGDGPIQAPLQGEDEHAVHEADVEGTTDARHAVEHEEEGAEHPVV